MNIGSRKGEKPPDPLGLGARGIDPNRRDLTVPFVAEAFLVKVPRIREGREVADVVPLEGLGELLRVERIVVQIGRPNIIKNHREELGSALFAVFLREAFPVTGNTPVHEGIEILVELPITRDVVVVVGGTVGLLPLEDILVARVGGVGRHAHRRAVMDEAVESTQIFLIGLRLDRALGGRCR